MISLAALVLAALPYCEGTNDVQGCAQWMANDMVATQKTRPELDIDALCEIAIERLPDHFWE